MPNVSQGKRFLWSDIIRIIAIYLVIQIHTTIPAQTTRFLFPSLDNIDVIGVPLFVLLSGSLLLGKNEAYKTFFRKRCLKVLVPWIIWTFLYMLYFSTTNFFRTFMSGLWFLPMIFGIYLLTPMLRIFVKHASYFDTIYLLCLWFIAISILPFLIRSPLFPVWEPTTIYAPIQFSGYFLLGYILIKREVFKKIHLLVLFLLGIFPFLLPRNFTHEFVSPGTVISSVFLFYFIYALCNKVEMHVSPWTRRIIGTVSGATFGVYVMNDMFLHYFKDDLLKVLASVHTEFLLTLITFFILTAVVIVMQKIPVIKHIVP